MSQPIALCRKKVQAELNKEIELCRDKEFLCRDAAEEECEEECHENLDSITTFIKVSGSGTLSRQSLLCCNIK